MIERIKNACGQIKADTLLKCKQSFEIRKNKCIEIEKHNFEDFV